MDLFKSAKYYLKKNISVVATDDNKRALFPWKVYQRNLITSEELRAQFESPKAKGIAVICGSVSGGLEVIDIDAKYDVTGNLITDIYAQMEDHCPDLLKVLYTVTTKSGGMHLYYYCEQVEGNLKLASRPATDQEKEKNPLDKLKVLIETRGEGGYVIGPPTEGYKRTGPENIPVITIDQRETLLSIMRSFNQVVEQVRESKSTGSEKYAVKPWEDYSERADHGEVLQRNGWTYINQRGENEYWRRPGKDEGVSASWHVTKKLFYCFTSSTQFDPQKAYRLSAVSAILDHGGDFSAAGKSFIADGYGEQVQNYGKIEKAVFRKKQEGYNQADLIGYIKKAHDKSQEEATEIIAELEDKWGESICAFWTVDKNGNPVISHSKLTDFLSENGGFFLYFYDKASKIFRVIRVKDGLVEETSTEQIKKFLRDYIKSLPDSFDGGINPDTLLESVHKASGVLLTEGKLEWMNDTTPDFIRDTKHTAYFPFRNGIVCIDKKKFELKNYNEVPGHIWRNQVIDFDITCMQPEEIDCEFYRFIHRISGDNSEKVISCCTFIGYLLHRYKDPARPWSVILAEETEDEDDGGGTGKGIFVKAISYLIKLVKIDGKNFTMDKSFALQRVSLDTQLIAVEDCDKKLDFEKFNSQLTEGSTVEKKNKDELFIEYKDSPKWVFSTNYVINIKGNHGKRRSKTFEFAPYFGPARTPQDEFGHLLFEDWDNDEWNRFYNFMFWCLSTYLELGLEELDNSDNINRRLIKQQFGEEFLEWFEDELESGLKNDWKPFKDCYSTFLQQHDFDKKAYSTYRFKRAMDTYCRVFKVCLYGKRNWQAGNQWEWTRNKAFKSQSSSKIGIDNE